MNASPLKQIEPSELCLRPFHILDKEWALLVGGREKPNPMTVSWGGLGTLWNRPVATVYVRPTRFTFGLLQADDAFTLNVLPHSMRPALDICGTSSGRDLDKWEAAGLKALPSETVAVPRVDGAELSLECRVIATFKIDPARFLDPSIEQLYPIKDYHTAFVGEVLAAFAAARFLQRP